MENELTNSYSHAAASSIMKKKVLHIINSLTPGGAETLLVNSLSPGGLQKHYDNEVAYFMGASPLQQRLDETVKVHCLNYRGYPSLFSTIRKLRKIITDNKIDIIHSHLNPAGVYAHFACPSYIPHVHTLHTTYSMDKMTAPSKLWMERNFYFNHKSASLIFLSNYTKSDFLKTVPFKGKAFVLNNFVQDEFFNLNDPLHNPAEKTFKMLAVGNLNPVKNHKYLIEIFSHLKTYNIELDIYGGGDIDAFNALIAAAGAKVTMKGFAPDLTKIICNYNLFIMPSLFEGFPLSLFEAMAAGIPCMVSDIGPLKEIAADNVIYFDLTNAEKVAGKIKDISASSDFLASLGASGKKHAAAIASRERYMTGLLAVYNEMLRE